MLPAYTEAGFKSEGACDGMGNAETGAEGRTAREPVHHLTMQSRKLLTLTGAEDVCSFDERNIVIRTVCGLLSVDGEGLHILKLDTDRGELSIEGTVNGLFYMEQRGDTTGGKKRRSLFR